MLKELTPANFYSIKPLMGEYPDFPVANSIIESNSPGRIFVGHDNQSQSAFVLTHAGYSYLIGSPHNTDFNQALKELLDNEIFPSIHSSDDPTLIFYPLTDGWETPLKEILYDRKIIELFRKKFIFSHDKFDNIADCKHQMPSGFSLHPINHVLLGKIGADMFPWESPQEFLDKGFGFWLMKCNEIVCECTSVFISSDSVEINIHTEEKYQKQGFAKITATAFIQESLVRGLNPNWECWWDNKPSVGLAQKLGFEPINDHPVILVELD